MFGLYTQNTLWFSLRPLGAVVTRWEAKTTPTGGYTTLDWSVSPEGARLALVDTQPQIQVFTRSDRTSRPIPVKPVWGPLTKIRWAADGRSWFAVARQSGSSFLLHVKPTGAAQVLYRDTPAHMLQDVAASPDGRRLVFNVWTWDSNVWLMENF